MLQYYLAVQVKNINQHLKHEYPYKLVVPQLLTNMWDWCKKNSFTQMNIDFD